MTGLVQTSSEEAIPWSSSRLIVSRDSFSLWTWARVQTARSIAYSNGCRYIFLLQCFNNHICLCLHFYDLSACSSVDTWSLLGRFFNKYLRYFVPQVPITRKILNGYLTFSVKTFVQNVRLIELWGKNLVPFHFAITKSQFFWFFP